MVKAGTRDHGLMMDREPRLTSFTFMLITGKTAVAATIAKLIND